MLTYYFLGTSALFKKSAQKYGKILKNTQILFTAFWALFPKKCNLLSIVQKNRYLFFSGNIVERDGVLKKNVADYM